ncbi:glutaminyl-peptide cyclotransferase [Marinimicrobium sp. C2-29]|uniref:glutaminyl-peptide cyclotransferase n=1 Tax=Marinimicrobium sp. C2-29 TaxID=3139825 RepID=UPI0031398D33
MSRSLSVPFFPGLFTRRLVAPLALSSFLLAACAGAEAPTDYDYRLVEDRPHDTTLFTQGLLLHGGQFYESGGRYGQSRLVRYRQDGRVPDQEEALADEYFAEGLTDVDNKLYLLTWRENTLFVFDRNTFALLERRQYTGEGWGLTDDGEQLIRTDGSSQLHFHRLDDFSLIRSLPVTEEGRPVSRLNELEYINGYVWANIWQSDRLVQIDPESGEVVGRLDLSALVRREAPRGSQQVLNGIAYDPERNGLWVTGKNWPKLFFLELEPGL